MLCNVRLTSQSLDASLNKVGRRRSLIVWYRETNAVLINLSEFAQGKMLELNNKVWEEGRIPEGWKEALIVPIKKTWERSYMSWQL